MLAPQQPFSVSISFALFVRKHGGEPPNFAGPALVKDSG